MIRLAVACPVAQQPAWTLAAGLIAQCSGRTCTANFASDAPGDVIVMTPVPDAAPWPAVRAGWHACCVDRLTAGVPVFLTTIFRHVGPDAPPGTLRRIRQLNLMAAELSQELGTSVIDLDAALAHAGGLTLGADTRLQSPAAVRLAAETIAGALLSSGLDAVLDDAALTAAQAALPGLRQAVPVVRVTADLRHLGHAAGTARYVRQRALFDDRGLAETLRDLVHRRIPLAEATPIIAQRLRARLQR